MFESRYREHKPGVVLETRERNGICPECKEPFATTVPSQVTCMKDACRVARTRKIVRKRVAETKARAERARTAAANA
jgi:hypothetical protein